MESLQRFEISKLAGIATRNLRRQLIETDRTNGARALSDSDELISFACND